MAWNPVCIPSIAEPSKPLNDPVASPTIDTLYELAVAGVESLLPDELQDAAANDTAATTRIEHARRAEREFTTVIDLSLIRSRMAPAPGG
jgi:hypothetical protein